MLKWVRIEKYSDLTGDTVEAINIRLAGKSWAHGIHVKKMVGEPGLWVNLQAVDDWASGRDPSPDPDPRSLPSLSKEQIAYWLTTYTPTNPWKPELLDGPDLKRLTGSATKSGQVKRLKEMGVPHKCRLDGAPVVTRAHVREWIEPGAARVATAEWEPNWTKRLR